MNNPLKRKRGRPFGSKVASGKKDGRPIFIPTEDQKFLVTMMSSTGVPHERQAKALGVNSKTLRKYFKEELQVGRAPCMLAWEHTFEGKIIYSLVNYIRDLCNCKAL